MTDQAESDKPAKSVLTDDSEVYRVLTSAQMFGKITNKPLSGAFKRRPPHPEDGTPRDVNGLSVNIAAGVSVDRLVQRWMPRAVVRLSVGDVRLIDTIPQLDVVPDSPVHANITGLPAHGEDDDKAELLATLLVRVCTIVYKP